MGRIIFITGGAKSGKSALALELAAAYPAPRAFIATAEALDDEMRLRIERHRKERGDGWAAYEEPVHVPALIRGLQGHGVAVLDCLTLWISNLLMRDEDIGARGDELIAALSASAMDILVVTNEVGMGIVPESPLARAFRDHAGGLNQKVAAIASEAYMAVSGMRLRLKP